MQRRTGLPTCRWMAGFPTRRPGQRIRSNTQKADREVCLLFCLREALAKPRSPRSGERAGEARRRRIRQNAGEFATRPRFSLFRSRWQANHAKSQIHHAIRPKHGWRNEVKLQPPIVFAAPGRKHTRCAHHAQVLAHTVKVTLQPLRHPARCQRLALRQHLVDRPSQRISQRRKGRRRIDVRPTYGPR